MTLSSLPRSAAQSRTPIWRIRKEDPGCLLATACIILYGILISCTFVSMLMDKGDIAAKAEAFVPVAITVGCSIFLLALILYGCHWLLNQVLSALSPSRKKDKILSAFEQMQHRLNQLEETPPLSPHDANVTTPTEDYTP